MLRSIDVHRIARRRALMAHSLRADGATYREISQHMGVCIARARDLSLRGARILDRQFQHVADALAGLQDALKAHPDLDVRDILT